MIPRRVTAGHVRSESDGQRTAYALARDVFESRSLRREVAAWSAHPVEDIMRWGPASSAFQSPKAPSIVLLHPAAEAKRIARDLRVEVSSTFSRGRLLAREAPPLMASRAPQGTGEGRSSATAPRRAPHLREPRARRREERSLGRGAARAREPRANPSRLAPRPLE